MTLDETDSTRHLIFVSHANPEDNDFARWISLQLAQHGYEVWCDVADLIGGEDFWKDIEAAIREKAAKFLFVLSRSSNTKSGTLNELTVAKITERRIHLKDFIIPLVIDDIPYGDMNIELARLNAISFNHNWASGLSRLLEKLEEDAVTRSHPPSQSTVAAWWRKHFSQEAGVTASEEIYASNWFQIDPPPKAVFFHEVTRSGSGPVLPNRAFSYPAVPQHNFLISFAEAELLRSELPEPHEISRSVSIPFADFASDEEVVAHIARGERRKIVTNLLRQSWELFTATKGVTPYELANQRTCIFHSHPSGKATRTTFKDLNGGLSLRSLTGYRTVLGPSPDSKRKRFWHFAISAKPMTYPALGFSIYYHVLFSDDGRTPWANKERMHAARRRQCWDWWNDDWRDRILAFLASLSSDKEILELPAGETTLQLSIAPLLFSSPISYKPDKSPLLSDHREEPESEQAQEDIEVLEEEIDDDDTL